MKQIRAGAAMILMLAMMLSACGEKPQATASSSEAAGAESVETEISESGSTEAESTKTEPPGSGSIESENTETAAESTSLETAESTSKSDSSEEGQVASASEMVEVEDVVEDWMIPIKGDQLTDGIYDIVCDSSSSMFRIDSCELTVSGQEMTAVMTMGGTGYKYLFMGTGEEAVRAEESSYIPYEEAGEVHTFTVPVEALDQGIPCAAFSKKKEKWYDRMLLFRSDSLPLSAFAPDMLTTAADLGLADGTYQAEVTLSGGSGRASVDSPATITVADGKCMATIVWSSEHYDYMIVDGEKYLPINESGNSTFEIPVAAFDHPLAVIADTTAMSEAHEIAYTLQFSADSIE